MQEAKNQLNGSLPMQRKSMECGGQPLGELKNCPCRRCKIRCYEPKEDGQLAMDNAKNGLKKRAGEACLGENIKK